MAAAKEDAKSRIKVASELKTILAKSIANAAKPGAASGQAAIGDGSAPKEQRQQPLNNNVVNAVRAITLNAINQNYEAQVCFETLRPRNHSAKFKNTAWAEFETYGRKADQQQDQIKRFLYHCQLILQAKIREVTARANFVEKMPKNISALIDAVKSNRLKAHEATELILALEYAYPSDPGEAFLARALGSPSASENGSSENGSSTGTFKIQSLPTSP